MYEPPRHASHPCRGRRASRRSQEAGCHNEDIRVYRFSRSRIATAASVHIRSLGTRATRTLPAAAIGSMPKRRGRWRRNVNWRGCVSSWARLAARCEADNREPPGPRVLPQGVRGPSGCQLVQETPSGPSLLAGVSISHVRHPGDQPAAQLSLVERPIPTSPGHADDKDAPPRNASGAPSPITQIASRSRGERPSAALSTTQHGSWRTQSAMTKTSCGNHATLATPSRTPDASRRRAATVPCRVALRVSGVGRRQSIGYPWGRPAPPTGDVGRGPAPVKLH
jgi:hypothetical protein